MTMLSATLGVILNSSRLEKTKEGALNKALKTRSAVGQNGLLTNQQRAYFKSEAHYLKPAVIIGQDGLTPSVLKEIDLHLELHQLIKIKVLGDQRMLREQFAQSIVRDLQAALVQHIGKVLVFYRPKKAEALATAKADANSANSANAAKSKHKKTIAHAPREVKIRKVTRGTRRNPLKIHTILGNQRITQGGLVKRVKKQRQMSAKKQALGD